MNRAGKKIAVILNGCGHLDGSEIHEAVLTLLAIEEEGAAERRPISVILQLRPPP